MVDTNIVLYVLGGNKKLAKILDAKELYISMITELELLGYKDISEKDKLIIQKFINDCFVVDVNQSIKKYTVEIKQRISIKLPNAIIASTAKFLQIPLITADKGFEKIEDIELILFNPFD